MCALLVMFVTVQVGRSRLAVLVVWGQRASQCMWYNSQTKVWHCAGVRAASWVSRCIIVSIQSMCNVWGCVCLRALWGIRVLAKRCWYMMLCGSLSVAPTSSGDVVPRFFVVQCKSNLRPQYSAAFRNSLVLKMHELNFLMVRNVLKSQNWVAVTTVAEKSCYS